MSGEHFWPQWAAPLLPNGADLSYRADAHFFDHATGSRTAPPQNRRRQGPIINRKVKTVCRSCNSGWMNQLEQAARPDITALASDQEHVLDAEAQERLTRWVLMKVMVSEGESRRRSLAARRSARTDDLGASFGGDHGSAIPLRR